MALKYQKFLDDKVADYSGKKFLVTCANSGIGFEACKALCYKHAHVIMACRNLERATNSKNAIIEEIKDANIDILLYDQTSLKSIKELAEIIKNKYQNLDGFVFNAGVYHPKNKSLTCDGFDLTLGTNFIGTFALYYTLADYFEKNKTILIFVGSIANKKIAYKKALSFFSEGKKNPIKKYCYSKFLIMSQSYYLKEKFQSNIHVVHPGVTSTNIIGGLPKSIQRLGTIVLKAFTHSPAKACLGIVTALDNKNNNFYIGPRGLFHVDGYPKGIAVPHKVKNFDEKNAQELERFISSII